MAAWVRSERCSLLSKLLTCALPVRSVMNSFSAISALLKPWVVVHSSVVGV